VAVVALLRSVGASKRLATLIEAESLFNDGTAFVLYELLLTAFDGEGPTAGGVVLNLFRLTFGGVGFGLAAGFLVSPFSRTRVLIKLLLLCSFINGWSGSLKTPKPKSR
jgi:NhaP-type Na+/H+ or K+/H+ antiporter